MTVPNEPTVQELLDVAAAAVHGEDNVASFVRGSDYEAIVGPDAILWSRQARRDTDLFRAIRFNDAMGEDLSKLARRRYGIERVKATRGQGNASLSRPNATAGAGTIWRGTRIRLSNADGEPRYFRVTEDTDVAADATTTTVPVESVATGRLGPVNATDGLMIEDPLWDTSWLVRSLKVSSGTDLEPAPAFRDRMKRERTGQRPGHRAAIEEACRAVGAGQVAIIASNYAGEENDAGLNYIYVGDLSYQGTAKLVRDCKVALLDACVAGDNHQVLPMVRVDLAVKATVTLRESPANLPITRYEPIHRAAVRQYFDGAAGRFNFTLTGIEAAIARPIEAVQDVSIEAPSSDAVIMLGDPVLNRYFVADSGISIRYVGA